MARVTATIRLKTMACRECGNDVTVGSNTRNAPRCLPCGEKAAENAARQMHDKSGEVYDKWRNAMRAAAAIGGWGGGGG